MRKIEILVAAMLTSLAGETGGVAKSKAGGTVVLATVPPSPGYPEGVLIRGNRMIVSAPAGWGVTAEPSCLMLFDATSGALEEVVPLAGEDLASPHAVSGMAFDVSGRVYVLSTQLGIVRVNLHTGEQTVYAPALPRLSDVGPGPLPNDIVFDRGGRAYVSDTLQGVIWRVPAGGGEPAVWLAHPAFAVPFGANGIRISPDESALFVAVTGSIDGLTPGAIYRVALVETPSTDDVVLLHAYASDGPDGLAFADSGNLYVSLALANAVSVLAPDGAEIGRIVDDAAFDNPAGVAFDVRSRSLLVVNHALLDPTPSFSVLRVMVDERGQPLIEPSLP